MTARTITTASELDALPDEHVLLKASGRYRYIRGAFEQCWVRPVPSSITGTDERMWEVLVYGAEIPSSLVHSEDLDLPVTVLHDPSATREDVDLTAVIAGVWDDGNAVGLDGWTGPERGSDEVDDYAVRARERAVTRALDAITPRTDR